MKNRDLKEILDKMPDDADLVIAHPFVIDEKEKLTAILDIPIIGVATNSEDENEIRFVLASEDIKKCFKPENLKLV